jgi:hypothetical protein
LAGGHAAAQTAQEEGSATLDSAVLYYRETDRVQAIEPELSASYRFGEDSKVSFGVIADSLTGATPIGAVPSSVAQDYVRPYKIVALGTPTTVTSASGGSTVVLVPPATGATSQTFATSTTVAANAIPLDHSFKDTRIAGHLGWEQALNRTLKLVAGGAYSHEHDYRSISGNLGLSQDFNAHNTTLNLAANYESDSSFPLGGTPTPFTVMSGEWKGGNASRREIDAVVGVTQVMTRRWLATLSYSYGKSHGYQIDPYRIISVVDAVSGDPTAQLYENRPDSRRKQSVFLDNKIHIAGSVLSLSLRGYKDDWGIKSVTADARYRWQFGDAFYVEPHARYYRQSAADFFHYFLVDGEALPQYASSDTRLGRFHAQTFGVKFGMRIDQGSEFSLRVEHYGQHGNSSPVEAIGQLKQQDLFPDLKAFTVLLGYSYAF